MLQLLRSQYEEAQKSLAEMEEKVLYSARSRRDEQQPKPREHHGKRDSGYSVKHDHRKRSTSFQQKPEESPKKVVEKKEEHESDNDSGSPAKKPSLASAVVSTLRISKTREAVLDEQKNDRKLLDRNCRMFGMLLGTLKKFKSEESGRREQERKRAAIDKKVEAAAVLKWKEIVKKEDEQLLTLRRKKRTKLRRLEKQLQVAEDHEVFTTNHALISNFIQTQAEPRILYLPVKHNESSMKCLKASQTAMKAILHHSQKLFYNDLMEIGHSYLSDDGESNEEITSVVNGKENARSSVNAKPRDAQTDIHKHAPRQKSRDRGADFPASCGRRKTKNHAVKARTPDEAEFEPLYD